MAVSRWFRPLGATLVLLIITFVLPTAFAQGMPYAALQPLQPAVLPDSHTPIGLQGSSAPAPVVASPPMTAPAASHTPSESDDSPLLLIALAMMLVLAGGLIRRTINDLRRM